MRRGRAYGFGLSFQDMLMSMIAIYAFLFLVAFALIRPAQAKPGVQMKAEYLLTLEWPEGARDDIDLHLMLPDEKIVNFRAREVEHALLDHDDLGNNGVYRDASGRMVPIPEHKEMITLRAIVPGTYTANVQVYRAQEAALAAPASVALPYTAKVRLMRLNPRVEELSVTELPLSRVGEQKTAFRFTVAENGDVAVDRDADVPFIPLTPKPSRR